MILKNILIIDGSYMLHRGLKQQNLFELRNSNLERTGGIYSFFQILQKEIKLAENLYPIVCWDDGQSDRRLSLYDNYKGHRDKLEDSDHKPFCNMTDEELDEDYVYNYKLQRKKIIEILNAFGIPSLLFKHTEGDDLMWWLSKHCKKSVVVTDDKDLLQLVSKNCSVRQPMKDRTITYKNFVSELDVASVEEFVNIKAFLGDGSDNIPGACFRVGEKTVKPFLNLYFKIKEEGLDVKDTINNEANLKEYCKANDIKFKSAYCNFDESQFLTNLELVDLNRIQTHELSEELIYEKIRSVYKNKDVKKPLELLNRHEIKTVNTNVIFESLILTRHNIKDE